MLKSKSLTFDIALIAVFTAVTVVCSWLSVPLGTVPLTLQTFGVLLTAGVLGLKRGMAAVMTYIALGTVGLPVFHGFQGGFGILLGATGGFIFGFVFTSLVVGLAVERFEVTLKNLIIAMTVGMLLCYLCGTVWYACLYSDGKGFLSIVLTAVVPFLIPDAVKIAFAAVLVKRVKKNTRFG